MTWVWYLAAICVLLVLSALFSGSETALFSMPHSAHDRLRDRDPKAARRVDRLLKRPARLLGAILISNLVVNVSASALFTLAIITWAAETGRSPTVYLGIGGFVMTGVLLVFGEVTPKVMASHAPGRFARLTAPTVGVVAFALAPFAYVLSRLGRALAPRSAEPRHLTDEELHTMISVGRERKVVTEREGEILWNLVGLEDRTVSEVMTPRIDMDCVEKNATIAEARELCWREGRSRLPVYEETVDKVVGVAYAKELLAADPDAAVDTVVRPAQFVPEQKRLPSLLDELRKKGYHIAVVVDEFGQTAGLVTLEDVLEAIFGEITDEYDRAEELPWRKLGDGHYEVEGEIDIATLNRLFRGIFDDVEHERLAGFVHERLGRLPEQGDVVRVKGVEIVVREVDATKLERAEVRRTGEED